MVNKPPMPIAARPITMTNSARCDVCGKGRGYNSKVSHVRCAKIRQARGFDWMYEPKKVDDMTNKEEYKDAVDMAEGLTQLTPRLTALEIANKLNEAFEGVYFAAKDIVYLRNEPDYLPPHMVIRLW